MGDEVIDDRRAVLEAAFETEETKSPESAYPVEDTGPKEPVKDAADVDTPPVVESTEVTEPAKAEKVVAEPVDDTGVDKAPQAWRPAQRAHWDKLPLEVRQEITRRERDITKTFGENADARQLYHQFQQTVQPYAARIQSMGVPPLVAVQELLKADYILSTAPKTQRAQAMARLINEYGIDILELDSALAGKEPPDPVAGRVEQLVQERLAPIQQFFTAQQKREAQAEQQSQQAVVATVENMAKDPKYPYFEDVRQDMADIIEMTAKRGLYLSPDAAYTRAIAMNPEVSKLVAAQQTAETKKSAALKASASASRALNASVSVSGSPGGTSSGASGAIDRRSTIAAAFDSLGR